MSEITFRLFDGTQELDLMGSVYQLQGSFPAIPAAEELIVSGEALRGARPQVRTLRFGIRIQGDTQSELTDNIRTLEAMLEDAKHRQLKGISQKVILRYQMGKVRPTALSYDGASGDNVQVADNSAIQDVFDSEGGIGFWIYPESDGQSNLGYIVAKRSPGAGYQIRVRDESAGFVNLELRYEFDTTDGEWRTSNRPIKLNAWNYCFWKYDSDAVGNNPTLYHMIQGGDFNTFTVGSGLTESSTPVGTRGSDVGEALLFGNISGGTLTFDGLIYGVEMWSTPPSAADIETNAEKVLKGNESGLVGYWPTDEGFGSIVKDKTSNGNDGTITTATWRRHEDTEVTVLAGKYFPPSDALAQYFQEAGVPMANMGMVELTCEPYGRLAARAIPNSTGEGGTGEGMFSVTFSDIPGSAPAEVELRMFLSTGTIGSTRDHSILVGIRSGDGAGDDLYQLGNEITSGEELNSPFTSTAGIVFTSTDFGDVWFHTWKNTSTGVKTFRSTFTPVASATFTIPAASLPRGQFRAVSIITDTVLELNNTTALKRYIAMGYSYGAKTIVPSTELDANGEPTDPLWSVKPPQQDAVSWNVEADLGALPVPPVATPKGKEAALQLTVYAAIKNTGSAELQGSSAEWPVGVRGMFLWPIGEGALALRLQGITSTELYLITSKRDEKGAYINSTDDKVQSIPEFDGRPFHIPPGDSKVWIWNMEREDIVTTGHYVPRTRIF